MSGMAHRVEKNSALRDLPQWAKHRVFDLPE